jgi:uridine kinase
VLKNLVLSLGIIGSCSVHAVTIIGIAGGTASGKTTLVKKISEQFPAHVTIIAQDDYYIDMSHLPSEEKRNLNFDHPSAINFSLLKEHLSLLKAGKPIFRRQYDFVTLANIAGEEVYPTDIIIVDGILLFAAPETRDLFDVKIFIDTDDDIRLSRRLKRDHMQYGWTYDEILKQWRNTVKPMHDQFVAPSKQYADLVIEGSKNTLLAIEMLALFVTNKIQRKLEE